MQKTDKSTVEASRGDARKPWKQPSILLERPLVADAQQAGPPVPFGAGPLGASGF